jgi:hypothetical protein
MADGVKPQVAVVDSRSYRVLTDHDDFAIKKGSTTSTHRLKEGDLRSQTDRWLLLFHRTQYEDKVRTALQGRREKQKPHAGELR